MGLMGFVIGTIVTAFVVSYMECWKAALVGAAVFPLMAVAGALQVKMMTGFDADSDKKYMAAGTIASEAVGNLEKVTDICCCSSLTPASDSSRDINLSRWKPKFVKNSFFFSN